MLSVDKLCDHHDHIYAALYDVHQGEYSHSCAAVWPYPFCPTSLIFIFYYKNPCESHNIITPSQN